MPFHKDDAYFVAGVLAGQMPLRQGATWVVKRAWRAARRQRPTQGQGDVEAGSAQEHYMDLRSKIAAILECLHRFEAGASQPGPDSQPSGDNAADSQPSGNATTTTIEPNEIEEIISTIQPDEMNELTSGPAAPEEQPSSNEAQLDYSRMRKRDLVVHVGREFNRFRKAQKGACLFITINHTSV